jgi:hypothetical protein
MNERRNISLRKYSNNPPLSRQIMPASTERFGLRSFRRLSSKRLTEKRPKLENIVSASGTGTVNEGITHLRNIKNIVMNSSISTIDRSHKKRSNGAMMSRSGDRGKRLNTFNNRKNSGTNFLNNSFLNASTIYEGSNTNTSFYYPKSSSSKAVILSSSRSNSTKRHLPQNENWLEVPCPPSLMPQSTNSSFLNTQSRINTFTNSAFFSNLGTVKNIDPLSIKSRSHKKIT